MLDVASVEHNSRRGYPERSGNVLLLHDEPQYEGHLFLPGYTLGNLAVLNTPIDFTVNGESPVSELQYSVVKSDVGWSMHSTFQRHQTYLSTLLAACQEFPKNSGVEVFHTSISQHTSDSGGGASHQKTGTWHFDYPWDLNTGWWAYIANVDTTQFALEPHVATNGIRVDDVSDATIWRPDPGEVVILDALTAHRRPRCYRRALPRTIFSLTPLFTKKGTPVKSRMSMLNVVEIGDYSNVPIDEVSSQEPETIAA